MAAGDGHLWKTQLEGNGGTWTPSDPTKSGGAPATPKTGPAVVVHDKDISVFTVDPDSHRLRETRQKEGLGPWTTGDLTEGGTTQVVLSLLPAAVGDPEAEVTRVHAVDSDGALRMWSTGPGSHT
ncbi:hypothetical protein ACIQOW_18985 [Kitasatospora sp. NPDC091335]|uniref:hypothetical protein n=1 Tax=Kitasatospora sp. NPDC091335 TaxID=3364085 RepID=UPI00381C302D